MYIAIVLALPLLSYYMSVVIIIINSSIIIIMIIIISLSISISIVIIFMLNGNITACPVRDSLQDRRDKSAG